MWARSALNGLFGGFWAGQYYGAFVTSGAAPPKKGGGTEQYTETSRLLGRPVGIAVAAGSDGTSSGEERERSRSPGRGRCPW